MTNKDNEYSPFSLVLKGENRTVRLKAGKYTVGCGDVDIPVGKDDRYVSDHQSTLIVKKNLLGEWCLYIQDTPETTNHTCINGETCNHYYREHPYGEEIQESEFRYRLYEDDIVRMGLTYIDIKYTDE